MVLLLSAFVTGLLLFLLASLPAPYVIESPGRTVDTLGEVDGVPLITVDGAPTYPTEGALRLTTVGVTGGPGAFLDVGDVVRAWLSPTEAVVPVELVYPAGRSPEEVDAVSAEQMTTSQENATAAALTELGYEVPARLVVAQAVPGTGADGSLLPGDVLLAAGGQDLASFEDLTAVLAATPPGSTLAVALEREGTNRSVDVVTGDDGDGGSVLGVFIDPEFDFPVDVAIRIDAIGGPSAGTMFALGIIDALTPGAMTGGQDIAGTGTISIDGDVGRINGIRQKLVGAVHDGATFFLAPGGNCEEVVGHVPAGLDVVAVDTLAEARAAVTAIGQGRADELPGCEAS
jgi:PDZ domain-containing protein